MRVVQVGPTVLPTGFIAAKLMTRCWWPVTARSRAKAAPRAAASVG